MKYIELKSNLLESVFYFENVFCTKFILYFQPSDSSEVKCLAWVQRVGGSDQKLGPARTLHLVTDMCLKCQGENFKRLM